MTIGVQIILCMLAAWLQMHPCLEGNLREPGHVQSPWQCCRFLLYYLHCLHVLYHTYMCTLHVYEPTVQPVASRSLFLDIQLLKLSLGEYTLFTRANLYYPTTRLCSYISVANLRVHTRTIGCKRSFKHISRHDLHRQINQSFK